MLQLVAAWRRLVRAGRPLHLFDRLLQKLFCALTPPLFFQRPLLLLQYGIHCVWGRLRLCSVPLGGARISAGVDVPSAQLLCALPQPLLLDRVFVLLQDYAHWICGGWEVWSSPLGGARIASCAGIARGVADSRLTGPGKRCQLQPRTTFHIRFLHASSLA